MTDLGRPAVEAHAARGGQTVEEYLKGLGAPLTPEIAGAAVVELVHADADAAALPTCSRDSASIDVAALLQHVGGTSIGAAVRWHVVSIAPHRV